MAVYFLVTDLHSVSNDGAAVLPIGCLLFYQITEISGIEPLGTVATRDLPGYRSLFSITLLFQRWSAACCTHSFCLSISRGVRYLYHIDVLTSVRSKVPWLRHLGIRPF